MILADENIHSFIIRTLRDAGNEVISVSEISKSNRDRQIIKLYPIIVNEYSWQSCLTNHQNQGAREDIYRIYYYASFFAANTGVNNFFALTPPYVFTDRLSFLVSIVRALC